ncbi:hypothetical protein K2173_026677 [Erythroxylum novogranatense]|uniref:Uncharacterized protein n=1 Tax=Erythroxylum novogranatense TaxID=1862640 RepID=A0AAV8TZA2_9ROSI|nr:hypothetical protein K2173_026677 [Erythroxylum novogranatense]
MRGSSILPTSKYVLFFDNFVHKSSRFFGFLTSEIAEQPMKLKCVSLTEMKLLMDLYIQMTSDIKPLDKVASKSHPFSSENVLQRQSWNGKEDGTLREQVQPEQSMEESPEKEPRPSSNSSVKLDDSYIPGSYIVAALFLVGTSLNVQEVCRFTTV